MKGSREIAGVRERLAPAAPVRCGRATPASGIATGVWACFGLARLGAVAAVYLFALGRVRLQAPRLERWLDGEGPALESPQLACGVRGERLLPALE